MDLLDIEWFRLNKKANENFTTHTWCPASDCKCRIDCPKFKGATTVYKFDGLLGSSYPVTSVPRCTL